MIKIKGGLKNRNDQIPEGNLKQEGLQSKAVLTKKNE